MQSKDKKMNNYFISVVIPCYNHGEFLLEAIDSVLNQTYQNFEIIIVNDGSTNTFTNELIETMDRPKTKTIITSNNGLSAARNIGIKNAKGDIIVNLDADDKYEKTFFEKGIKILKEKSNVGIVSSYMETFGYGKSRVINFFKSSDVKGFIGARNNAHACSIVRKICWKEVTGYDEQMKQGFEDWDFWLRITSNGWNAYVIEELLFKYRQHQTSMLKETQHNRVPIMKYLFEKNSHVFQKYFSDALLSREEWNLEIEKMYHHTLSENKLLKEENAQIKSSFFYKLSSLFYKFRKNLR